MVIYSALTLRRTVAYIPKKLNTVSGEINEAHRPNSSN